MDMSPPPPPPAEPPPDPPAWDGWAPPPPPGPPDGWGWEPPAPRRRRAGLFAGVALLVLAALALLSFAGNVLRHDPGGPLGSLLSQDNGSSGDVSGIVSRVSQSVVDISSTFPDGAGEGSGMIVTASGEVLTNNHVVDGALQIVARIGGVGPQYDVRVIGADAAADVALLQIQDVSGLPTVPTGNSGKVSVGDPVVAVGNALGREGPPSSSTGHVTALDRTITATDETGRNAETLDGLIQVDANVLPGDSGGPLVDASGRVIGMDTAASARHFRFRAGASQGFAIPIDTALSVAQQIRRGNGSGGGAPTPSAPTPLLGVVVRDAGPDGGAMVASIAPGSAADAAGIVAGDVIVSFDGRDVQSAAGLRAAIRAHHPGDRVQVGWVEPSGQEQSTTVRLGSSG